MKPAGGGGTGAEGTLDGGGGGHGGGGGAAGAGGCITGDVGGFEAVVSGGVLVRISAKAGAETDRD
jgi:hypothetical protein